MRSMTLLACTVSRLTFNGKSSESTTPSTKRRSVEEQVLGIFLDQRLARIQSSHDPCASSNMPRSALTGTEQQRVNLRPGRHRRSEVRARQGGVKIQGELLIEVIGGFVR